MGESMRRWISEYRGFLVALLAFLIVLVKLLYRFDASFDIAPEDETRYLQRALSGNWGLDGVVYFAYLRGLSLLIPDPIALYQTNFALVTVLFGLAVFALASVMLRSAPLAFFLSSILVVTWMTVAMWPFIAHFAASIVLFLAAVLVRYRKLTHALAVALPGAILLMYIRPEFLVTVIGLMFAGAVVCFWQWRERKKVGFLLPAILIMSMAVLIFFNPAEGNRSFVAFSQHYAFGLSLVGGWTDNPWTTADSLMARDFPGAHSIPSAFVTNPGAFFGHVFRNVRFLPEELLKALQPLHAPESVVGVALVAFFLLSLFAWIWELMRSLISRKVDASDILIVILAIPVIISVLVIFPRVHYLVLVVPLLWIAGLRTSIRQAIHVRLIQPVRRWAAVFFAVFLVMIVVLVPWRANRRVGLRIPRNVESIHGRNFCTFRDRALFLRSLHLPTNEVRHLNSMGYMQPFLPAGWTEYLHYNKGEGFDAFLEQNGINAIWISPALRDDARFRDDPEFLRFEETNGWVPVSLQECNDMYLLLRKELVVSLPRSAISGPENQGMEGGYSP